MTTTIFSGESAAIDHPEELLLFFRSSEKPSSEWRIGTEHEKLGFDLTSHQPLAYEGERGIRKVLEGFAERFDWSPVWEGENLIALLRRQASITLEPGGQLELSGAPLYSAHDTCRELQEHLQETRTISEELGVGWLGLGRNPVVASKDMPWMPKERYAIMRSYLHTRGEMAHDMMLGTATVQTNLDYASEEDMARKTRVSMAFSPIINTLFANSPFAEGKATGLQSTRAQVWRHMDNDRCGIPEFMLRDGFTYQEYVDYALDVPMFFIHREGHYLDYSGRSFRKFLETGMDGHVATQEDWLLHLTTIFPEVRVKNVLELRMADVGPAPFICALAALSRGMLYDATALSEAEALTNKLPMELYNGQRESLLQEGLGSMVAGKPVQNWAEDLLDIAASGLERLNCLDENGENEVKYLAPLLQVVTSGKTQAQAMLELWNGEWQGDLMGLLNSDWRLA